MIIRRFPSNKDRSFCLTFFPQCKRWIHFVCKIKSVFFSCLKTYTSKGYSVSSFPCIFYISKSFFSFFPFFFFFCHTLLFIWEVQKAFSSLLNCICAHSKVIFLYFVNCIYIYIKKRFLSHFTLYLYIYKRLFCHFLHHICKYKRIFG